MIGKRCEFSECKSYRYTLWREWKVDRDLFDGPRAEQYMQAVLLNPSTADETVDDPTVARVAIRARSLGFGALCVTNLFAYRATDPEVMKAALNPVGPENDRWLIEIAKGAGLILAGWGKHGAFMNRAAAVVKMLPPMQALWVNADGSPKHPLYCAYRLSPFPYIPGKLIAA